MESDSEKLEELKAILIAHCKLIWVNDRNPVVASLASKLKRDLLDNGFDDIVKHL